MDNEIKTKISEFLINARPLVCLKQSISVIFRSGKLLAIESYQLRIGDIRIVRLDAVDFVKGLSPEQWTEIIVKSQHLQSVTTDSIFPLASMASQYN